MRNSGFADERKRGPDERAKDLRDLRLRGTTVLSTLNVLDPTCGHACFAASKLHRENEGEREG